MNSRTERRRSWWPLGIVIVLAIAWFAVPSTRHLAARFFGSLRVQKAQAVNVDLSNLVGPNANPALHQMITQMISDKVKVTVNEAGQRAADADAASRLAGFHVGLLGARSDAPELAVVGEHAFDLTVDRARLQEILKEAGHPNLALPPSIDGAIVAVKIPRSVMARYGDCPGRPSAAANVATPPPATLRYADCLQLHQGPSPQVSAPEGLDFQKLAEIALGVAGMTPAQASQFLSTVNWKATLGVSMPRFMRSYQVVAVNGVRGTLLNTAGRRGPSYTLVWAKGGMVYSLTGYGDPANAATLADSLK